MSSFVAYPLLGIEIEPQGISNDLSLMDTVVERVPSKPFPQWPVQTESDCLELLASHILTS